MTVDVEAVNDAPVIEDSFIDADVDTQVNTYATNGQSYPSITSLSDGGYVVAWSSYDQDGSADGIYLQRYDSSGAAVGSETLVNTYTTDSQSLPSITSLSDGGYVVAWTSSGQDGSYYGIYLQRYNSSGAAVGSETLVNTYTTSTQYEPSITSLSDGGYVVAWSSSGQNGSGYGIYLQRYNSSGAAVGSETLVNTYTTNGQSYPSITSLSDGGYVVTWHSNGQDGSGYGIYSKRYDASGQIYEETITVTESTDSSITSYSSVLSTVTDIDSGDTHSYSLSGDGNKTVDNDKISVDDFSVVVNSDGSYTLSGDFEALSAGEIATVTFDYIATDDSGADNASSEPATVTITVVGTPDAIPPIVIDLDGDGTEFVGVEDGIAIDVDGDGDLEQSAWAASDDGVLFYDLDNDGAISSREEFAFADYSDDLDATDLEGLKAGFDTNNDNLFDSTDDKWSEFKVWQDKDGDGIADDGEVLTLDELGITSIALESDGITEIRADGDVLIHGHTEVSYIDGTTGIAADAEFSYLEFDIGESLLDINNQHNETVDSYSVDLTDDFQVQLLKNSTKMAEILAGGTSDIDDGGGTDGVNYTTTIVDSSQIADVWIPKKDDGN
ncbi:hypothetical protein EGW08_023620 [Elysia chlorotica]|uniref:Cadherin domain-containing protein n=1 Tax=Elysia chlorotica TaxID=188477 RepID=A0A3S1BJD4_ELYCH|nr:hypothetical protein EGW08_023620 [Elysia chlorotica]